MYLAVIEIKNNIEELRLIGSEVSAILIIEKFLIARGTRNKSTVRCRAKLTIKRIIGAITSLLSP